MGGYRCDIEGRSLLQSGSTDLLFDEKLVKEADLHLPRLARPFRLLEGEGHDAKPKTVKQAAQMMWRLMMRAGAGDRFGCGCRMRMRVVRKLQVAGSVAGYELLVDRNEAWK